MSDEQKKEQTAEPVKNMAKPKTKAETTTKAKKKSEVKTTETKTDPEVTGAEETFREKMMAYYRKAYPKEKCFHVTSDNQVFLSGNEALARRHQKSVNPGKEVETIE